MSRIGDALRKAADESGILNTSLGVKGISVLTDHSASRHLDQITADPEEELASRGHVGYPPATDHESLLLDLPRQGQQEVLKLVQRVFTLPNASAPQVVVFVSVEGNGSSDICFRAGEALAAQTANSVCLVDANVLTPVLHQFCGAKEFPGLSDATTTTKPIKDFVVPIARKNMWLMPSGQGRTLFASDRLRSRILELKAEFDCVLIAAPAVASSTDAVLLGQMSDGVILVVEANSTRRETALLAKETFTAAKVKILGAILNNRKFPIPQPLSQKL